MENKNFFFHFLTWELVEKNSTPLVFLNFLRNPPNFFGIKRDISKGFNLWCYDGQIIVGGRPYPKLWGKYKPSPSQDFIDFADKNPLKNDFFHKFITSICYFYILLFDSLISFWFWTKPAKTNFENFSSIFNGVFHSKIYEILDRVFCIFPITLGRVDPQQWFDHQYIPNWTL